MLGVVSQGTGQYNFDRDGNLLPAGEPARRNYATDEYEFYAQDSWRLGDKLTVNGGLRYSLASPPWETNGLQVSPNVSLGERFKQREADDGEGHPREHAARHPVSYLAGPENGRKGFYDWDKNNFAPRVSAAWTPTSRLVVRGGYSLVYDRIGPAARAELRRQRLVWPVHHHHESRLAAPTRTIPSVRFQGINVLPPSVPPPRRREASRQLRRTVRISYATIDDTLVTPYAHTFNAVASFELTKNFNIEAAYVGRQGRNLLVQRDLFMPLNLADPQSGTDYFTASTELIKQLEANGMDHTAVTPIAYFENMFPDAANAAQAWDDPTFAG